VPYEGEGYRATNRLLEEDNVRFYKLQAKYTLIYNSEIKGLSRYLQNETERQSSPHPWREIRASLSHELPFFTNRDRLNPEYPYLTDKEGLNPEFPLFTKQDGYWHRNEKIYNKGINRAIMFHLHCRKNLPQNNEEMTFHVVFYEIVDMGHEHQLDGELWPSGKLHSDDQKIIEDSWGVACRRLRASAYTVGSITAYFAQV